MINSTVLVGRLTRDPELKYTTSNIAVATFSLAVNRNFKDANGERETDFIKCVIWRQQAENLANWAKKGALIGITGCIQTRSYENQQGQRVYVTEVVAENFQMLKAVQRVKVAMLTVVIINLNSKRQVIQKITAIRLVIQTLWISKIQIYPSDLVKT